MTIHKLKFDLIKQRSKANEKRFYNRETNRAAFCALQFMSFNPLPFSEIHIIIPFIISRILNNHDKVKRLSANSEIRTPLIVPLV